MEYEDSRVENAQREHLKEMMGSERFKFTTRPYTVDDVLKFHQVIPRVYPATYQAKKLYALLKTFQKQKKASFTFGALDPVQVKKI
jgi:isocitrate lyase